MKEIIEKYPMQPVIEGRFEANPIVTWLIERFTDMNDIAVHCQVNDVESKYQEQLAQLVGYSVGGYSSLSYVSEESVNRACKAMEKQPTEYEYVEVTKEYEEAWNCLKDFAENVELHTKDDEGRFHKIGEARLCLEAWLIDRVYRRIELTAEQLHERKVEELANEIINVYENNSSAFIVDGMYDIAKYVIDNFTRMD